MGWKRTAVVTCSRFFLDISGEMWDVETRFPRRKAGYGDANREQQGINQVSSASQQPKRCYWGEGVWESGMHAIQPWRVNSHLICDPLPGVGRPYGLSLVFKEYARSCLGVGAGRAPRALPLSNQIFSCRRPQFLVAWVIGIRFVP